MAYELRHSDRGAFEGVKQENAGHRFCFRKIVLVAVRGGGGKASSGRTSRLAGAAACGKEDEDSDPGLGPSRGHTTAFHLGCFE